MANKEQLNDNAWPIADPDFTLRALGQLKGVALPNGKAFYFCFLFFSKYFWWRMCRLGSK